MRPILSTSVCVLLACGTNAGQPGAGSNAPPAGADAAVTAPDSGSPGANDGGVAFDAGQPPGFGLPDAGTPADGGGPATTPDAGVTADAGVAPDAGTLGGGGGPADAGVTADDCDGLAPDPVGAPTGTHTTEGDRVDCAASVTGSGALALQANNILEPQNSRIDFVAPDGTVRASTAGTTALLLGRLSTFQGVAYVNVPASGGNPGGLGWAPQTWDDRGNLVVQGETRLGAPRTIEDPLGGFEVLVRDGGSAVENYDERGNLRWRTQLAPIGGIGAFVVDRLGNTLVTGDSTAFDQSVVAQWIDHSGAAQPAVQLLGKQSDWNHLEGEGIARVGSGVFVHADQWWQLDSLSTVVEPAPAWFVSAQQAGNVFAVQMVRNGRAYGLITTPPGATNCVVTVEIVTPSGKSCGKASFDGGPGRCWWPAGLIGYDGTFVQRVPPPSAVCNGGVCSCTWKWWSGFFR